VTYLAVTLSNALDYRAISDCRVTDYQTNRLSDYRANWLSG